MSANPTLGRLTSDERTLLATRTPEAPTREKVIRATRRGSVVEMPMFPPTPEQARARILELEAELAAHRAEIGGV